MIIPMERLQIEFKREVATYTEDDAVITMHFASLADGLLNDTIRQAVEARFITFWNAVKGAFPTSTKVDAFRWYDQQVWPTLSPLLRSSDITDSAGTNSNAPLPPQIATSVTLETERRARWGRFYLPSTSSDTLNLGTGRLTVSTVDSIAQSATTFIQGARTDGAKMYVWSPRGGKGPPAFSAGDGLLVLRVRVDDIFDVVRRRRWQSAPYRKILPV